MLKRITLLSIICIIVFLLTNFMPGEAKGNDEVKGLKLHFAAYINAVDNFPQFNNVIFPEEKILNSNIIDRYGILKMQHRYAVKFVKYPGSLGRLETYKKVGNKYVMQHTYTADYPKDGPKSSPWDMRTVGGNTVRYLYRTTRSGMNGWNNNGEHFGVYKVSFPMPHDMEPLLKTGKVTQYQYEKIPTINYKGSGENRMLYPHPHSAVGADIVLHTQRKGSRGCIMVENEAMSRLYHEDLVTENDREIIPFITYDEDVVAPPIGELM